MKYVFPIIIGFITYKIQAAVGLYWIVNNIITIFQERAIAKSLKSKEILEIKAEVLK
jgi:membrane protein insertase Oxa1/YidC/SpoIIIJ